MRLVVINHVTLDGVMQAPGRSDEDTRDGFAHGGWADRRSSDPDIGRAMSARMARSAGLVLGRRTYDDLLSTWNARGGPFRDALNDAPKYVASTTLSEPLPWPNSTLLGHDLGRAVAGLKEHPGGDLHILGSGELITALMRLDLIDEFSLVVHPIVLGTGRRLFREHSPSTDFELVAVEPTTSGALVTTLRPSAR